jgi:hypothetical protein
MMGKLGTILLFGLPLILSCKHLKKNKVQKTDPNIEIIKQEFIQIYEAPVAAPDSVDLDFRLVQIVPFKDSVQVKMRYGGGCVKPHIFEMYTSAMSNKEGVVDVYLSHKTHDDKCKAFVFTVRTFIWSHLFSPGHKVRINQGEIIQVPDK